MESLSDESDEVEEETESESQGEESESKEESESEDHEEWASSIARRCSMINLGAF